MKGMRMCATLYSPAGAPGIAPRVARPQFLLCRASSKGFGNTNSSNADNDERAPSKRVKAKKIKQRRELAPIPNQGKSLVNTAFTTVEEVGKSVQELENNLQKQEDEFTQRLALIRLEGEKLLKERAATQPAADAPQGASSSSTTAAFDAPADIYANPPPISQTLMSQLNSDVSDPKLRDAKIGPSQVGLALGAIVFGLIFVLVSGGDYATSKRYKGIRPAQDPPDQVEAAFLKGRIAQLENARAADPNNLLALEELAVAYAKLFEFEKAANLLDKLVAKRPNDAEAWRLLGETTLLSTQSARSVAAYEKAVALSGDDLQVLTGLVDAYIANAEQSKAVDFLTRLRTKLSEAEKAEIAATAAPVAPSPDATPSDAVSDSAASSSDESAASSSQASSTEAPASASKSFRLIDTVSVDLLTAKAYGSWRGHDNDALAVYDALIKSAPEDFRGYLAKGLFLKERGRRADAERMFLQARFYAPESKQAFVKSMSETNPVLDLPDND